MFRSSFREARHALRALSFLGITALVWGCGDRERPITPTGPGNAGPAIPLVTITAPGGDTTVARDTFLVIMGEVQDDVAVDSIFFDITGAQFSILPVDVDGTVVPYSFPISTTGLGGGQITISITAKDEDGNFGGPAVRILSVQ
jgi:hypothetical protein